MPTINDANGTPVIVNSEGQLYTLSITHSAEHHANQKDGVAYTVVYGVNPAGAGDCFFYLKNNDDKDLIVEDFTYMSSAAEEIYIEIANTGTAVLTSGAALTPANLNTGSGNEADVTCWGNISDGAVDITGLTGGREIDRIWITAAADNKIYNFSQDVVIQKNGIFSMWCVGGDTLLRGVVNFYMHD